MFAPSQADRDPDWCAVAGSPALSLVVAMEPGLRCPVGGAPADDRDPGALRLLDALVHARVRLVVLSQQPRAVVDGFRVAVPRALWVAESGDWLYDGAWSPRDRGCSLGAWIEAHCSKGPVMAIGSGISHPCFTALGPFEIGVSGSLAAEQPVTMKPLPGPSAIRALLWWLVQERVRAVPGRSA